MGDGLDEETHLLARFELMQSIMLTSQNLPLRLIVRTLIEQMAPNLTPLHPYARFDGEAYKGFSQQLDEAFARRDKSALRVAFNEFSNLNRETMMRAFAAACEDISLEAVTQ